MIHQPNYAAILDTANRREFADVLPQQRCTVLEFGPDVERRAAGLLRGFRLCHRVRRRDRHLRVPLLRSDVDGAVPVMKVAVLVAGVLIGGGLIWWSRRRERERLKARAVYHADAAFRNGVDQSGIRSWPIEKEGW
jgi:hypothetical protein